MFGFAASVHFRLLIALAFALATWALVWLVERDRDPLPRVAMIAPPAESTLPMAIEATFPVSAWTVTGGTVVVTAQDERHWRGQVSLPSGGEALIEAVGAGTELHGLKVQFGTRESALWGEGTVIGTVRLP